MPTSTTLPATWVKPAMLAVGATTTIKFWVETPLAVATFSIRASEGKALLSKVMTALSLASLYPISSKISLGLSAKALAGPEPMAMEPSGSLMRHPANWLSPTWQLLGNQRKQ